MKKIFFILATAGLLAACSGGSGNSENANDTIVSPELQEVAKTTDDLKQESQQINEKADSLLNQINK